MQDLLGFDLIFCERLTVTLLHFLWQGGAIGVVAAVLSQMLFRASSQVRYITHFAALFAMFCCLPITFSLVTVPELGMVTAAFEKKTTVSTADGGDIRNLQLPIPAPDANPILIDPNAVSKMAEESVSSDQPISPPESPTAVTTISGEADPEADRYLPRLAPYVTAIYLAGVVLLLVRLVRSAWLTRQLGSSANLVTECDLLNRMQTQAERLGLRVLPALRWCNKVSVPVVIGVFRPVILLPAIAATGLTIDQLQAVMAHELAHIRRYDLVMNVLQRVIESLLFFHPAVWWVSRQITNEREHACDELVLTVGPGRAQYADALVRMAELACRRGQLPVTALATTGSSTTAFKRRVLKVLEMDAAPTLRPSRITAVIASLVVLFALAMPLFLGGSLAGGRAGENLDREEIVDQLNQDDEREAWREIDRLKTNIVGGAADWLHNTHHYETFNRGSKSGLTPSQLAQMRKDLGIEKLPQDADLWSVPAEAWSHIGRLESLTELSFVASDMRGQTRHLAQLKNLRSLRVGNCQLLPGDLAELKSLTNLEELDVMLSVFEEPSTSRQALVGELSKAETETYGELLSDPKRQHLVSAAVLTDRAVEQLGLLGRLRVLRLINTVASEQTLANLSRYPQLERLEVSFVSYKPESLLVMAQLKELSELAGVPYASAQMLPIISGLSHLEKLDRGAEDLTDEGTIELLKLQQLKSLVLWNARITDVGFLRLAELPQLESLDVRHVKGITDAGVQRFRELRPTCRVIHTDEDLSHDHEHDATPGSSAARIKEIIGRYDPEYWKVVDMADLVRRNLVAVSPDEVHLSLVRDGELIVIDERSGHVAVREKLTNAVQSIQWVAEGVIIAYADKNTQIVPVRPQVLLMLKTEGVPHNGGDVVLAQIGYTGPRREWMDWLPGQGTCSLAGLPAGKHWLIARHPWTVFPVVLPLESSPLEQMPRAGLPPQKNSSNQYSTELTVEVDNAGKEFIRVDVKNMTDEPLSFCELDLVMGAGLGGDESEAHSPLWLTEKLYDAPRIEIAARQSGSFRIDWADWVRRGVWDPMSGVQATAGPSLPEQQPGKIWVRIGGPGFGTLPVAVTHPDVLLDELSVTLPDGSVLELLGMTTPPIKVTLKDERTWWHANGTQLADPVKNPNNLGVGEDKADGRQAFFRLTSRQPGASLSVGIPQKMEWSSSATSHTPFLPNEPSQLDQIIVFGPIGDATTATLEVRVSVAPWTAWKFDLTGKPLGSPEVSDTLTQLRNAVEILRAGPSEDGVAIWTRPFSSTTDSGELKIITVDKAGKEHFSNRSSGDGKENVRGFPLSPEQFGHFELRVRPFGPKVKFENVSLQPGKRTEPKVSVEPIAEPQAAVEKSSKDVAEPQLRVELIGLTYDTALKKETWTPNGQPMPVPDWLQQLPKLDGEDKGKPAPLFLYEVHGLRAKPSFRHRYQPAVISGDDEPIEGRPYRMAVLYEDLKPERFFIVWGEHPAVRITDEPWGPWRTITKEGQFAEPVDPNALYREGYEMVTLHGFRPLTQKPNDPEPAADAVRTGLVLKHPEGYDALYAIEIEAVPSTAGPQLVNVFTSRPVQSVRNKAEDGLDIESEWPVDTQKIEYLRYRIRPFRHRFEFQEVAYEQYERPATSAPFKVIYKKLEHDLPKPVAGLKAERTQLAEAADRPHFDLQVVDAVNQQPISGADVRVRYYVSSWQPNNVTPPKIADVDQQFQTDAKAMFPISFPAEMQGLMLNLQVSVRHPDYVIEQSFGAWQVTAEMAANPAKTKEKLFPKGVISLKPGFEVSGQILAPDGTPAQGVNLYAAWQMPEYFNMPPHAVTDADGRYKFRVSGFEDTYLFIIPSDAVALSIPIQEQYGEHPVVKLEAGTVITGRILDENGKPLKDVVVQGNGDDTVYTGFPDPMVRVATDAEGRYKLPPLKLPVDVRVARFGYLGGWSSSGTSSEGAYLPVLVRAPGVDTSGSKVAPESLELDFRPVETVTLTARAYSENGNPTNDANIELFGVAPDPRAPAEQRVPRWRGSFRIVPGQVGVYQLKAPRGLVNAAIDLTQSGTNSSQNNWTRAVRDGEKLEGLRTNAGWAVLDRDDDSIIVGTAPEP